jgi:hypothetical protein
MSSNFPPFIEQFNSLVKDCEAFLSIARDSELQQETCGKLEDSLVDIKREKSAAISNANEDLANLLLGCECVANSLLHEIKMWLALKHEEPEKAWDLLVTAQMETIDAARSHEGFSHLEHHNKRLEAIEQLVFPPQVFISSGMIVHRQECSICGGDYDECEHLIGKPYMGEFCYIIARDLEVDHVAIVESAADKRCRVTHFDVEGGRRNRMTWKVEKVDNNPKQSHQL